MIPALHNFPANLFDDNTLDQVQIKIHDQITTKLTALGVDPKDIDAKKIRIQTVIYQIYWYNRLKNNPQEQQIVFNSFVNYLFLDKSANYKESDFTSIFKDHLILNNAKFYVEKYLKPIKTIDLVISTNESETNSHKILCLQRNFYPFGLALPGGIVLDTDEDNPYKIRKELYTALKIISTKVFGNTQINVVKSKNSRGVDIYSVKDEKSDAKITIEPLDEKGFVFKENIKVVLRPSDPRHIVDTIAFKCVVEGQLRSFDSLKWYSKSELMDAADNKLAFNHHRELINQVTAQSNLDKELAYDEHSFIKDIISEPLDCYNTFRTRFQNNMDNVNTSFPELFPVVSQLLNKMYTNEINFACGANITLAGMRDKATISLRHVSLKNRIFCPYLPTLKAIFEAIAFFDIYSREKRNFYAKIDTNKIHEHNPADLAHSSYHMYRYKYRMDDLLSRIPNEIVIPTFESFTAAELMLVRCVPIRFVGLATDFLYVDEFEQSPEEFLMHDINHNWRMMQEDLQTINRLNLTQSQLSQSSYTFSKKCIFDLKFKNTDTPKEIEFKKIKLIILFEIVHEDARPFLHSIINEYIQLKEGGSVPFEVPRIDPITNYMDMVDTLDTGISTLSYVRNKLQYGFYDQIDNQSSDLVEPSFRTAENIAAAAYEMLVDYQATPNPQAGLDEKGNVSYDWLLKRACAVGPDNIHNTEFIDPSVVLHGDGAAKLNPKRYQVSRAN
jgi:hypothetical protein